MKVEALDRAGRAVPTADHPINFKISGEGVLLGVGNGDPNCQESDKEPNRSLFNGMAQVLVQATRTAGTITVEASSDDWRGTLRPAQLTITTKKVEMRPSVE